MARSWAGSTRKADMPPNWQAIRRVVLERDRYTCTWCRAPGNQVDHIDNPHDHSPTNLRTLCEPCHLRRSSAQGNTARWARQTTRRPPEPHPGLRR